MIKSLLVLFLLATHLAAHDLTPMDRETLRAHLLEEWTQKAERGRSNAASESRGEERKAVNTGWKTKAQVASGTSGLQLAAAAVANAAGAPSTAKAFLPFTRLDLRADSEFLYVGSNGLPDHNMMVGITAWQQQVPLPQYYFGDNAWRIPLNPVPAKEPAMVKGRFLRGAIALAVNGIPIFNPQNNRGEIAQEIGELDQWGGHCGRADDYHYHIVPLHLQAIVGKDMPLAYALDGYAIYGLTEPDGSPVGPLDECHGHESATGYHYHASLKYPYVIGGFHGEVVEEGGQVDPQPRAQGVRPDTPPLRGATITDFESTGKSSYKLGYKVNGETRSISYRIESDGTYPFEYDNGSEGKTNEVYTARRGGGEGGPPIKGPGGPEGMKGKGKGKGQGQSGRSPRPQAKAESTLNVNGDGVVTAQEFAEQAKMNAAKKGLALTEAMSKAKEQFNAADHNRDGKLDTPELDALNEKTTVGDPPPPRSDEPPARDEMKKTEGGGRGGRQETFVALPDQPRSSDGRFMLSSPVVEDLKNLPLEFTGDGDGISPPVEWSDAPATTQSYALIMDHVAPGGEKKWYWTVYDIPANIASLPKDSQRIGKIGSSFRGAVGYEPPHSKGPGAKTYVITLYALAEPLKITGTPGREELLAAMAGKVLASSSLRVVHSSGGSSTPAGEERPRPQEEKSEQLPSPPPAGSGDRPKGPGGGKGKGKGGPPGLIKPSLADTMKLNVYADNWFMLYVNGRLVAVDSIQFTPHNVVSVDFLPEYPMTLAVLAKDNADPKTGMEYGSSIGDGGFCLKFADGTVTNATWKAKNFFHGPINGDTTNPQVKQEPLPANWWAIDFDDSTWKNAKEYTVEEVDPKQPYFENNFEGAKFIWTDDIALDNTVIFRTKVEKPGWTPRWNTKPDLDVTGAPQE